jgi:flagellar motility protein MotE (MotC chaperone)
MSSLWCQKFQAMLVVSIMTMYSPLHSFASESENGGVELPAVTVPVPSPLQKNDYCASIANLATDARYALQMKTLEDLQKKIDERITVLEATRAENETLVKTREETVKTTQKGVVDIFAKMKPDVAAAQFEILDVETSASILKQLNARAASTILNEMKAPIAAAITAKMAQPIEGTKGGNGT